MAPAEGGSSNPDGGEAGMDHVRGDANVCLPVAKKSKVCCGSCGRHGHKTWRTKTCAKHSEYLKQRVVRSPKTAPVAVGNLARQDSATLFSDNGQEMRHGDDGLFANNLAAASNKIISDSDVVNSLDCLPLVDDGDQGSG